MSSDEKHLANATKHPPQRRHSQPKKKRQALHRLKTCQDIIIKQADKGSATVDLQIQGTRMTPSYANNFMGELGKHLLQSAVNRPSIWRRYKDDFFAVCNDGEEQLQQFLQINTFHPAIKFTAQ